MHTKFSSRASATMQFNNNVIIVKNLQNMIIQRKHPIEQKMTS